jgi:hypothetical protein
MRADNRPLPGPLPLVEAGCGAVLVRLPCGTALTLDPESARRTGQALIDAGRCSRPRRNPGNVEDRSGDHGTMPRWLILPIAFLLGAGLLIMPSLMFADMSLTLVAAAVLLAALITAPVARQIIRQRRAAADRALRPRVRALRLVAGRDVGPDSVRTVTQRIGKPDRRG